MQPSCGTLKWVYCSEGCEQSSCVTFKHKTLTTEGEGLQAVPGLFTWTLSQPGLSQVLEAVPVLQALELSPVHSVHSMLELVMPLHSSSEHRQKSEGWLVGNQTLQC